MILENIIIGFWILLSVIAIAVVGFGLAIMGTFGDDDE